MAYDEYTAERVRRIVSGRRDVVERKMMGGLCFMLKGAMCFSVSGRGGLLVRVGAEAERQMLTRPNVEAVKMGRRTMSGFVRVGPDGYRSEKALKTWVQRGIDFALALPAKPLHSKAARQRVIKQRK